MPTPLFPQPLNCNMQRSVELVKRRCHCHFNYLHLNTTKWFTPHGNIKKHNGVVFVLHFQRTTEKLPQANCQRRLNLRRRRAFLDTRNTEPSVAQSSEITDRWGRRPCYDLVAIILTLDDPP